MNNKSKVPLVPRGRFAPTIPNERRRRRKQSQVVSQEESHSVERTSNGSTNSKTQESTTLKAKEESETFDTVKQEPLIQTTTNMTTDRHSGHNYFELDSSDEEPWRRRRDGYQNSGGHNVTCLSSSSLLPVVLPISNQSTNEKVDDKKYQNSNFPTESVANKLCQEKEWFFVQLPPILPLPDSVETQQKELQSEREETVDESASSEAKIQELKYIMSQNDIESQLHPDIRHMKSCNLGSLRIFRSGKVQLAINGMTYEILQGAETSFLEKAMQVDWESNLTSELGDIRQRWICVPDVYNDPHLNKVPHTQSSFMKKKKEENMLWKTE
ncbi:hypothetical protein GpartN1_g1841.t1 [Galdieria partita]|uniref:Uncharacterized protein n=1 Tax=Galdieria partita TaxID=83374 RepID=A0A9C7PT40_9RHOD|nr:hypothetical protein GpartN1_g1841.t1 [Galdieria partita]